MKVRATILDIIIQGNRRDRPNRENYLNWGALPPAPLLGGGFAPQPLLGGGLCPTPPFLI